jgi:glycosyltransferase involved in cell wall biosynthesis
MRVLMQIRSDGDIFGGGDIQHMKASAEALSRIGVEVVFNSSTSVEYKSFDLVHLFNTTRINDTFQFYQSARKANRKIVLSPIWHSLNEMHDFYRWRYKLPWFPLNLYSAFREIYYARRSRIPLAWQSLFNFYGSQKAVVSGVDAVIANSVAEIDLIKSDLGVEPRASFVVPNGFNSRQISEIVVKAGERNGIVVAGRIEPRKNQCKVILGYKMLRRTDVSVEFYGALNNAHPKYIMEFKRRLNPGLIEYRGLVNQVELYKRFATAEVVVLASYFETTGLVALEALACGAKIVVSDTPYTREYFRDNAFYCNPYSSESIGLALKAALSVPSKQRPIWLDDLTWDRNAELTFAAYDQVLGA